MSTQDASPLDSIQEYLSRRTALYAVLLTGVVFYLVPVEAAVMTMFKADAFVNTEPYLPPAPSQFSLDSTMTAIDTIAPGIWNSILMAVPATVLSAVFGSLAAYGLTTIDWKGQVGVVVLIIAGIFIPYQAVLVPISTFWYQVVPSLAEGIVGVVLSGWEYPVGNGGLQLIQLTITHVAYGIPICTLLFRGYYQAISDEMIEAARLDGASAFSIYKNIIFPLSYPMFAVTLIYQFTQVYNDLLFALVLLNDPNTQVATQRLVRLTGGVQQDFTLTMAGAIVAAFPTLVVYIFFGDRFAKGVAS
ncbi:carbohydrate ABC transporter permease [Haloarcula sp. GH36]|uniref:carbohydrate ABC transporter permease n=1 Tax=Haloarcula montana TaxID=3111776 RepID=UPI002D784083|nr:carbohydrate ABC transporter permease [Haloarcula sp. GH36]